MVRFVHTSDWQVGMRGGGLGTAGELVARERIRAVDRLLTLAEREGAAFVVACGDLFEHDHVALEVVEEVARVIAAHRGVGVHAITGNHDLPGPGSVWNRSAMRGVGNLRAHLEPGPVSLGSATLWPFPVRSRYTGTDPLASLPDLRAEPGIHVALAHGHLTSITFGSHEENIRLPLDPMHVERSGLDYLALGHWHGTRLVAARDGASRVAYSGTPEQTAFRETDAGNVLLVEIAGKGAPPVVTPRRVGGYTWACMAFSFAGDVDVGRLRAELERNDADFLELSISGDLPSEAYPAYRELLSEAEGKRKLLDPREGVTWTASGPSADEPISDAGLAEVDQRLAEVTGEKAEEARAARELLRRLVREVAA